jgi:hypothetical protein
MMRLIRLVLVLAAFALCVSGPASAQDWIEYISKADFFSVNFPGEPKVQEIKYRSEYGYDLPARVYSAESGRSRYSATVVDYSGIEKLGIEKSKTCPQENVENCIGAATNGLGYWRMDLRGALVYASWKYLQRTDAKVTNYAFENIDLVEGHRLQVTNADQSLTRVGIFMHQDRLYIIEGTVPKGYPEAGSFQYSLRFNDKDGIHRQVRYQDFYSNVYPPPPRVERGPGPAQPDR